MDKINIINSLVEYYSGGSVSNFAKKLGLAQNTISNWKARNTIDNELIFSKCEGINAEWLLSGGKKGKMLKTEAPSAIAEGVDDKDRIKSLETSLRSIQKIQKQTSDHVLELKEMLSLALAAIGKTPAAKAAGKKGSKTGATQV